MTYKKTKYIPSEKGIYQITTSDKVYLQDRLHMQRVQLTEVDYNREPIDTTMDYYFVNDKVQDETYATPDFDTAKDVERYYGEYPNGSILAVKMVPDVVMMGNLW